MNYKAHAAALMQNPMFKTSWSRETLAIWLTDHCKCVYCGRDMLESYDVAYHCAAIDHLLPKVKYPQLEFTEWNLLLSCRACNCIKRDWDPNEDSTLYRSGSETIDSEQRLELIRRATDYIKKNRQERVHRFATERDLVNKALGMCR